ncbi:MAG TPA: hypothetical protein VJG13_15875 [Thermoanaerobaculia bacterium]|nr:hypothetical protein [Thermoanaerobaculia bacterium]
MFWTDKDGMQLRKRSIEEFPTPLIRVADRSYFTRVQDGLLWTRGDTRFALESLRSRNTGELLVVLSVPWPAPVESVGAESEAPSPVEPVGDLAAPSPVAAMVATRLPSLLHPLLPPGRDFAVLDDSGRAIFHSRPERSLVEDFVRESEGSPRLRALLHSRTSRRFEATYWGLDRQMAAIPVPGLPWHVVALQDKSLLRTANFEALGLTAGVVLLQLLLVVAALVALRLAGGPGSLLRLCPGATGEACRKLAAVQVLLGLSLIASYARASAPAILVAAVAVPVAAVGLGALALLGQKPAPRAMRPAALAVSFSGLLLLAASAFLERSVGAALALAPAGLAWAAAWRLPASLRRGSSSKAMVVAAGFAVLATVSVLPAAAILRVVYEDRLGLETRRGQLHLAQALAQRQERLRTLYRPVPGMAGRWRDLLCDARDVHFGGFAETTFWMRPEDPTGRAVCDPSECPTICRREASSGGRPSDGETAPDWSFLALADRAMDLPFVNDHAVGARLIGAGAGDGLWRWSGSEGGGRMVLRLGPPDAVRTWISSQRPRFRLSISGSSAVLAAASASLVGLFLVLFARRVLLLGTGTGGRRSLADFVGRGPRRLLLVCPPDAALPATWREEGLLLDLRAGCDPNTLTAARQRLGSPDAPDLLCLDHLESGLERDDCRGLLRDLIESALDRPGLRFVALLRRSPEAMLGGLGEAEGPSWRGLFERCAVEWASDAGDPEAFEADAEAGRSLDDAGSSEAGRESRATRALRVLIAECRPCRRLQEIGLELLRRPEIPELDPETVVQRVREEATDHYRTLWQALPETERFVLVQLAAGNLPGLAQRPAVAHLVAWGLAVRDPALRLMNESFRDFVLAARDADALRSWEWAGTANLWRQLRLPFFALLTAAVGFLFLTQPGLFDSTVAFASVAAAGVPALLRVVGSVRQGISAARGAAGP